MAVTLGRDVLDAIRAHGRETYPNECCGALIGADGVVIEAFALPNTTEEGPRRRFLVRPSDYQGAEGRATGSGRELLGFYHSHPDHPAQPSQYDLDHAWPFFSYVIVSVREGKPREGPQDQARPRNGTLRGQDTLLARCRRACRASAPPTEPRTPASDDTRSSAPAPNSHLLSELAPALETRSERSERMRVEFLASFWRVRARALAC